MWNGLNLAHLVTLARRVASLDDSGCEIAKWRRRLTLLLARNRGRRGSHRSHSHLPPADKLSVSAGSKLKGALRLAEVEKDFYFLAVRTLPISPGVCTIKKERH